MGVHANSQFLGDVEADVTSGTDYNARLWEQVAPRVARRRLRAIFIECSYPVRCSLLALAYDSGITAEESPFRAHDAITALPRADVARADHRSGAG